jgi:hypothetical protein
MANTPILIPPSTKPWVRSPSQIAQTPPRTSGQQRSIETSSRKQPNQKKQNVNIAKKFTPFYGTGPKSNHNSVPSNRPPFSFPFQIIPKQKFNLSEPSQSLATQSPPTGNETSELVGSSGVSDSEDSAG